MRIDRKRALRIGGRAAGFVAAAALAVATVAAAALVPWPEHRAEAPSVLVQPAESRQQRVCPGPILTLGEDAAAATTASSVGAADIVTAAEPADALLEQVPLAAPGNPSSAEDGTPVAIAAEPGGVDAGMLAGAQSQGVSSETLAGFAAAACGEAVADAWLVAGATTLGRSGLVLLSNPTAVAATVDVRVTGEAGPVEAPSALGIIVPPGTQRVLSLAGLAPNLTSPVVHVTSTGGAIAASLETSVVVGLAPAGVELTGVTAAPATTQVIPGFVVPEAGGIEASEDHADGDDFPAVRLFAPGDDQVDVSIGIVPESGSGGSTIDVDPAARQRDRRAARRAGRRRLHRAHRGRGARPRGGSRHRRRHRRPDGCLGALRPRVDRGHGAPPRRGDDRGAAGARSRRCTWSTPGARPPRSP